MRIIAGTSRGTKLSSPDGYDTRPTLDRVREAIFSMLFDKTRAACVLDLFAGSGAMGLEALSRGAVFADFVDFSPKACECVRVNAKKTRLENFKISRADFKEFLLKTDRRYDIIFLDPPYAAGYYDAALDIIAERGLLKADGIIVLECDVPKDFDCRGFDILKQKKYGKASVYFLQPKG